MAAADSENCDDRWNEIAAKIPDDVVHHFAAVGYHDQIAEAEGRFGGVGRWGQRQFVEARR